MNETLNPKRIAQHQLKLVRDYVDIPYDIYLKLREPQRILKVRMVVPIDDGSPTLFHGWRSQHCNWLGPLKGGIRYHPDVTEDEIIALSMWMTWKCSLAGLPFGGGKGGITFNRDPEEVSPERITFLEEYFPKKMSRGVNQALTRDYTKKIRALIGPDSDIPAPDVNTNKQNMAWIMDEFSSGVGYTVPSVVTGKPIELGGSLGRDEATGRGTAIAALEAVQYLSRKRRLTFREKTVAVEGFGNAGSIAAKELHKARWKIIAVSDSRGAVYNQNGLDPVELLTWKERTGSVVGYIESEPLSPKETLLLLPCTILIPAALENSITAANAPHIKAAIIAEASNGPTTPAADTILHENGVFVVPDILANAGGVIVSYVEYVQGREQYYWDEREVNTYLHKRMKWAFDNTVSTHEKYDVHMRTAAGICAVERVVRAGKYRR